MLYLLTFAVMAALLVGGFAIVNRPQFVLVNAALPADFPADDFSHQVFERLLQQYVDQDGNVDYESWHGSADSLAQLESYLAAVSRFSPESTPKRFASRNDELAYWIYGYNAYVIWSILKNWPIDSVTDVKAPLEAVRGLGFFYRLRFTFGNKRYSLLTVENRRIRRHFQDARVHFVLNCASDSCPVMRPTLPTGKALEELLTTAASEFVSDPKNVAIDHDKRQIALSRIFKWFRKDFIHDLAVRGRPSPRGLVDYVASVAPESLRTELASTDGYTVVFRDYDWSLNHSE